MDAEVEAIVFVALDEVVGVNLELELVVLEPNVVKLFTAVI